MNRNDPTGRMWLEACELIEQAGRMHRQFFQLATSAQSVATWEPPVDVFENEREVIIVVAMPGVAADRVEVVREPGAVVVRGVRPFPVEGSGHRALQLEIPYGAFERRIPLPSGLAPAGAPELSDGCLLVRLRKPGLAR
ncbi:MAG: Hsp20/alpha crystallin family protein [Caldimonas sp.]